MTKYFVMMSIVISHIVMAQKLIQPEAESRIAFEMEMGYGFYGLESLKKTIPLHIGFGIRFPPEKRFHDILKATYSQYQTFNIWESQYQKRYGKINTKDIASTVIFGSLFYKKAWRVQRYRFTRHKIFLEAGIGLSSITVREKGTFFELPQENVGVSVCGGIYYEYVLDQSYQPKVRTSIMIGINQFLPLYRKTDSLKNSGNEIDKRIRSEYQSTIDILNKNQYIVSIGICLQPKYIDQKERRRLDSIKDTKDWLRMRPKDADYFAGGSSSSIKIENASNLTEVLVGLPGVEVIGYGSDAQIKVRAHVSIKGSRNKEDGNHPDAKSLRYAGISKEEAPNLNYRYDEPLFVINGVNFIGSYSDLYNQINLENVTSVMVVKGAETAFYGMKGANGVILIETK